MFEALVALGILAGQQGPADAPREDVSVVSETVSVAPRSGSEFVIEEEPVAGSLYLPYD